MRVVGMTWQPGRTEVNKHEYISVRSVGDTLYIVKTRKREASGSPSISTVTKEPSMYATSMYRLETVNDETGPSSGEDRSSPRRRRRRSVRSKHPACIDGKMS